MDPIRKSALLTGVLFIVTFATSIPALVLYAPVLDDANYVLGAGADTRITVGALLEVMLAIAGIGTAVALFPILKRYNEGLALAYVTARVVESIIILVGIMSLMSVVTLRQDFAGTSGADAAAFVTAGKALVAVHKWSFLLGPGFCAVIENGLMLGYLMYRTGLVPRPIAVLGLVAGPLGIVAATVELFGAFSQVSTGAGLLDFPEFAFEALFGTWLIVKGFRPVPLITGASRATA
ncbi:MAG TPA: DUF4386 domain-containing protein [Actinocrinis sp.]|jgi:hypothetical protein